MPPFARLRAFLLDENLDGSPLPILAGGPDGATIRAPASHRDMPLAARLDGETKNREDDNDQ